MGVEIKSSGCALFVDYAWCTGCHSCEVACRKEHGFANDQYGIKVNKMFWETSPDSWVYLNVPVPTSQCDTCDSRRQEGKLPTCVHHCQAQCLEFGSADEMFKRVDKTKRQAVFTL